MYYEKRIRYIDYLENGEKQRNCGYVKITVADGRLLLEMQIRGLYETDDVASEVMLEGAGTERRIGTVVIRQGAGNFRWELLDPDYKGEKIAIGEGLRYGQLERIAILLSPRRSLRCIWSEAENVRAESREEELPMAITGRELPERALEEETEMELPKKALAVENGTELSESVSEMGAETELSERAPEAENASEMPKKVSEEPAENMIDTVIAAEQPGQSPPESYAAAMKEDKWQQLQMIYPHIQPFRDERDYLSLRPEDFVILSSDAYRLVRNSFLLHGYYNYEHLILTSVSYRNAEQYYIGVPGNFYEKEKQVAIMYGFNSFECQQEPAKEGDFGYYMIRVEL